MCDVITWIEFLLLASPYSPMLSEEIVLVCCSILNNPDVAAAAAAAATVADDDVFVIQASVWQYTIIS